MDSFLKSVLTPLSRPSCRFNRNGEPLMTIPKSWRGVHLSTPALAKHNSYRQLTRRTRFAKLSIVRGKKRTDICPACLAWDRQVLPKVRQALEGIFECLGEGYSLYFDAFNAELAAKWWAQEPDFEKDSSHEYCQELGKYIGSTV